MKEGREGEIRKKGGMRMEEEEVERRGILWIFEVHVSFLRQLCVLSDLSVLLCTLQEKGDVGLKEEQTQYVYAEPPLHCVYDIENTSAIINSRGIFYIIYTVHQFILYQSVVVASNSFLGHQ